MILLTGDTHGEIDIGKLSNARRQNRERFAGMTKDDYLIILGDFGFVWDGGATDDWWLDWLNTKPYTTLFIDGNHENFDLLAAYPTEEWNGGRIQRIRDSVLHLMRGQFFELAGKSFFTMGGAESHDMDARKEGLTWWRQEMPCDAEYEEARRNLEAHGWQADFVLTHSLPSCIQNLWFDGEDYYHTNRLTDFFDEVYEKLDFKAWYSGHYHMDVMVQSHPQVCMLYNDIRQIL